MRTHDVVIVGAGIIGLSIAWQLARRSSLAVAVLDKGSGVGEGSTGASSAVCRYRYTLDEVVDLARNGIGAYRQWREFTALDAPRAQFQNDGVLWMPGGDLDWSDREHARLAGLGVATEVLDASQLSEAFPSLSACTQAPDLETGAPHDCDVGGRSLFEPEGGYMDPVSAAQDLVEACRGAGVDVRFGARVDAIDVAGGRVRSVTTADGRSFFAGLVVNAAGPWCRTLHEAAGLNIDWDLAPVRIQVLHRDRPDALHGHIPVTVDMQAGIYFRTQNRGQQLLVSSVREEDERETVADPDRFRAHTDEDFELRILHALHHRLPALPYRGKVRGYCGLYTVNLDDVHPVLGPTSVEGLWLANGFSGHGFKLAPAIGSMIAQAITGTSLDSDTNVPLSFLGVDRTPIAMAGKSVLA